MRQFLVTKRVTYLLPYVLMTGIVLLGGIFRFYNLNWDSYHYFHPDERNIANAVSRIHFFSQMDPEFFAYGSLPIYIYRAIGDLIVWLTKNPVWVSDWGHINLIGRSVSALLSTLSLYFLYKLGCTFSKRVGFIAAWFLAFTPLMIQEAHFSVTESAITFFAILITLTSVQLINHIETKWIILIGVLYGLATATKISALTFAIIPCAAMGVILLNQRQRFWKILPYEIAYLVLFLLIAAGTYTFISPYTFLRWNKFMESMRYEGGIVTGKLIVVYVYQFLNTKAYVYQVEQLFYTQGIFLAFISIIGSLLIIPYACIKKQWMGFFLFIWPMLYFVLVGSWYAKFVRYLVPLYPFFSLAAAWSIDTFRKGFARHHGETILGYSLVLVFLAYSLILSIGFMHIYTEKQTRIKASEWVYEHIPDGAIVLTEHWDDGLPIPLNGVNTTPSRYRIEALTIYEPDNEHKRTYYAEKLSQAEFIIINSRRLYGTLIHLTDRYPLTSTYYRLLFDGSLGYHIAAQFSVYPAFRIGPWQWEWNDYASEESFQVYDHPKVIIFQNVGHYTKETLKAFLQNE